MIAKLGRFPVKTQAALQQLACMGSRVEFSLLELAYQNPEEMHSSLWEAVQAGLILRTRDSYSFSHDRVLEAAYSLMPEASRAAMHLRIGTLLATNTPAEKREEAIFETVNQLNRGAQLITSREERERAAKLNLIAARRAKASTAYASALLYLNAGRMLLTKDSWDHSYNLLFSIEYLTAECELLTADTRAAELRLSMLIERTKTNHHIAAVTRLRITLYTTLDRSDRAVEVCLEFLNRRGTSWSLRPTKNEVMGEYEQIWTLIANRKIEELIDLPILKDPELLDVLDVLTETVTPALFYDENLSSLVICHIVNLSLQHGNSDASCFAYVWLAIIAGPRFDNYKDGFRFGQLGYELVEQRGLTRYQARTYMSFGDIVVPWTQHIRTGRDLVRRAFVAANAMGDLTFMAYSCNHLVTNLLAAGDPLAEVQREAENGLQFAKQINFGLVIDHITAQLELIHTLRGLTPQFGTFDEERFDELQFERHLDENAALAELKCWYWIRKLQARFFAGEYAAGVDASSRAQQLLWTSPSQFETAELQFYSALCHAACWDVAADDERQRHFLALTAHHKQLEVWATNCPDNFENRAILVSAEIARIEGRNFVAMGLYDDAIQSARENGFIHNEGVANEVAARFYIARGFEKIAYTYLHDARYCYVRWGADAKVRYLELRYPQLRNKSQPKDPTATILTPIGHLDLGTVIKVSQALSGETIPEKLIDTIMRTAIQHAGAQRGLLILTQGVELLIKADAAVREGSVIVNLQEAPLTAFTLPVSIAHYVARTQEGTIVNDASAQNQFSADPYIRQHHARSVLCLPLVNQAKLIGLLYLENDLAPDVFTPERMTVLKLLASEAAMSLENSRLYSDLREREARVRRLVNSNIIGIFIWNFDGRLLDVNDAFLRIVGYDRHDFISGSLQWHLLTPAEWRDRDNLRAVQLRTTGVSQPYEKEYLRKDGTRVPVLVGAALFAENGDEGVAFVVDLTDRKRAEDAMHESEQRYRQVQTELAHANRVAAMGQLSASIAHEINQPIGATITYANAALSWLRTQPPDLEEVRQALVSIVESGVRAGEVIERIRALVKKEPPRKDRLEINEAILEVIALIRGEITKNGILAKTRLAESLPITQGDRVQIQQVMLNLLINAIEAVSGVIGGERELLISTEKADSGGVLVTVSDLGPGFAPESADRLFESFYTTKVGGLGMGLSICHSIIEAHQGQLCAVANIPRGSVFQFTLPAASS